MPKVFKDCDIFLEEYKKLWWIQKIFVPSSLRQAVEVFNSYKSPEHLWSIASASVNDAWFFQRWFVSCLKNFLNSPLIQACKIMRTSNLLTPNNFNKLSHFQSSEDALKVIDALNQKSLIEDASAQINFDTVCDVKYSQQPEAVEALFLLGKKGMLKNNNCLDYRALVFNYIKNNICPITEVSKAAVALYSEGLLSQASLANDNFNPKDKEDFPKAVLILFNAGLLSGDYGQENLNVILNRQYNASHAASILVWLNDINLIQTDIAKMCRHALTTFPLKIIYVLYPLNDLLRAGLLNTSNCAALFSVYQKAFHHENEFKEKETCYYVAMKVQSFLSQFSDNMKGCFLTQSIFDEIISLSQLYLTNKYDDKVFQPLYDKLNRLDNPSRVINQVDASYRASL